MTKFNTSATGTTKTTNHEGSKAYKLSPELSLYSLVCTSTLSNQFYVPDTEDTLKRIRSLIAQVSPDFVAKLAVYARENMHLRSIPMVLVVELAKASTPQFRQGLISSVTARVIQRPDEITEILSYYAKANGRTGSKKLGKLSNQLKKGIAQSFHKFDEYQFAKYNRKNEIRLRDALFLTHPKPVNDAEKELFKRIAEDTLATPDTWETKMSAAGKSDSPETSKKDVWEGMIDGGKMGYMALLRNLRNILEAEVSSDHIDKVCSQLSNRQNVIRSKQFPFRFLSAYRMLVGYNNGGMGYNRQDLTPSVSFDTGRVLAALEDAMLASAENIPMFKDEKIKIASDVSGSMFQALSEKSTMQYYDVGLVLSMLLQEKCKRVVTGIFGTDYLEVSLPKGNILENSMKLKDLSSKVGWSTNGHRVIMDARNKKQDLDRIMIFTDLQMWNTDNRNGWYGIDHSAIQKEWALYKKEYPNCKLYLFDLSGYGTTPLSIMDNDVHLIAGWSNQVFKILSNIESGGDTLDEINAIEI